MSHPEQVFALLPVQGNTATAASLKIFEDVYLRVRTSFERTTFSDKT